MKDIFRENEGEVNQCFPECWSSMSTKKPSRWYYSVITLGSHEKYYTLIWKGNTDYCDYKSIERISNRPKNISNFRTKHFKEATDPNPYALNSHLITYLGNGENGSNKWKGVGVRKICQHVYPGVFILEWNQSLAHWVIVESR